MSENFITNQNKLLSEVINNILPSTQTLFALVGYFYFSGFEEIYKNVIDKEVKILVGLEIETDLVNKLKEFEVMQDINLARGIIRENYYKSLISIFNDTDYFDTEEKQQSFKLFLEKLRNGTLEIKKTLQPNHAKLYIFENKEEFSQNGIFPGSIITGSSNLTRAGLKDRFEINIISRDSHTYKDAYKIFQELWSNANAVEIVNKNNFNEFMYNVVEKTWLDKLPKPFLLYIRVLEEYFSIHSKDYLRLPGEITKGKYINLKYQEDAIKKTIDVLDRHNGVIIADVVGLGKSIIASVVAHNIKMKTIIISPPHLLKQWDDYRYDFDYNAKLYSSGKIEQAVIENDSDEAKLIIIDEAHKYRNEFTIDYAKLHELCQRNKVMLLTATPFNNQPQDVFSMIKLFQIPTRSTLQTVDNLSFQFKKLIVDYKKIKEAQRKKKISDSAIIAEINKIADEIRNILTPVVIRRSRLDLQEIEEYKDDLKQQKISFPKVNDPEILEYDLQEQSNLYEETLTTISPEEGEKGFLGARYMPTNYIEDIKKYKERIASEMGVDENLFKQIQINLAKFMRRLLVRRFESSVFAFKSTLEAIIKSSEVIKQWYYKLGKIPIYKKGTLPDVDKILESTGEDLDEELKEITLDEQLKEYQEKGLWLIDKKEVRKEFIEDVERDIKLLNDIYNWWFGKKFPKDFKLESFSQIIKEQLKKDKKRKMIVFSEFADTVNYLYKKLKQELRIFKYTSQDASDKNKEIIKQNFDAGYKIQKNDFDILIATDAISEGFNLHRAGTVFNYDIPYNPTRVIQRVGRINRINKKVFDELFIYNFFPTATGEREIRIKQISTLKIAMVHALFGEDTKVLTKDEEVKTFFVKQFRETLQTQEEISPETKYENFIKKLHSTKPELIEEALKISQRTRIQRTEKKDLDGVIIFGKKGQECVFKLGNENGLCENIGLIGALQIFTADIKEQAKPTSEKFEPIYENIKKNLFSKKTEIPYEKAKQEAIHKLQILKEKLPTKNDYLEDLIYVLKTLDALPGRYIKMINALELKNFEIGFANIESEVARHYLVNIIEREKSIDEGRETIILAEELI